jgi:hypothetical protein
MTLLGRRRVEATWPDWAPPCLLHANHHWHLRFDLVLGSIEECRRWCCWCATAQIAIHQGDAPDARVPDPDCGPFATTSNRAG